MPCNLSASADPKADYEGKTNADVGGTYGPHLQCFLRLIRTNQNCLHMPTKNRCSAPR
jgi:hypothetical protein